MMNADLYTQIIFLCSAEDEECSDKQFCALEVYAKEKTYKVSKVIEK